MKKPKKPLSIRSAEVMADYVLWEYLSTTGWKRLFKDEYINALFNGTTEGAVSLEFVCPQDMAEFTEGEGTGRIRARLLRAENIYQIPAVYKCPFISGIQEYRNHLLPQALRLQHDDVSAMVNIGTTEGIRPTSRS